MTKYKKLRNPKFTASNIILNIVFILIAFVCVFPVLLTIGISVADESSIIAHGYQLIPEKFSFSSYEYIWQAKDTVLRAYGVTIFVTVVGTVMSTLVLAFYAYAISRKDFKYRKAFTFYMFFTMLFSGGVVAWYMVITTILHLKNTIWVMILPHVMNAWNIIVLRSFFTSAIPDEMIEAAKLDGAGEFKIFFSLVMPLSLPGLATIALFQTLGYWNDWTLPLYFITKPELWNLQFLLQNMIANIQKLTENAGGMYSVAQGADVPVEGARMALCLIAAGPIIIVYPFFQKYFIQGLTVGSIKG